MFKDVIKKNIRKAIMGFFYLFRDRKKKSIFFYSFSGNQYSDNPRAISEYIHQIRPDIKIYWLLKRKIDTIPEYVECVDGHSFLKVCRIQSQANAWVFNNVVSDSTFKGKKTLYIQTFHGDRALKKVGYDAQEAMGVKYRKNNNIYIENKICNYWVSGSIFAENYVKTAYGYYGDFLKFGTPRDDCLVKIDSYQDEIQQIRNKLKIPDNCKVLLFAPTFRDAAVGLQSIDVDLDRCLRILRDNNEEWICLIRAHSSSKGLNKSYNNDRTYDVSEYPDMKDLLLISDILITDYSSCACDFILTKRPTILAQFDIDFYTKECRSLSITCEEAGFLVANTQDDLDVLLKNLHSTDHCEIEKKVDSYFGTYETGNATEKISEVICNWIDDAL